ncbi:uncharacterized protein [Hyperolius riggenbachi]|uniref:uncharacterized protein isoform X2 n=1 Tax=Hyperolius riggenbachi TaxID=752182 RepID=UPI0035A3CC93
MKTTRKLKHQQIGHLLLPSISVINPPTDAARSYNKRDLENNCEKISFRYPRKTNLKSSPDQHSQEQPMIRHIIIDLRPVLRQIIDDGEVETAYVSKQERKRPDAYTQAQAPQSQGEEINETHTEEKAPQRQGRKQGDVHMKAPASPIQRNSGVISISLPSIVNCKSSEEETRPAHVHPTVNLVAVTSEGTFTCKTKKESRDPSPVCFPRVILNQDPLQKASKEQRHNMNSLWLGVDALPMAELVRVVKEKTDSRHHTLISQVLCSLREKQEKVVLEDQHSVGMQEGMLVEASHKAPLVPCVGGAARLTWMKRR